MHIICLICTDDVDKDASVCKCGHVFHTECLQHWLKMNKTCPQCRTQCSSRFDVIKLFISGSEDSQGPITNSNGSICVSPGKLRADNARFKKEALDKDAEISILKEEMQLIAEDNHVLNAEKKKMEKNLQNEKSICTQLKKEMKEAQKQVCYCRNDFLDTRLS